MNLKRIQHNFLILIVHDFKRAQKDNSTTTHEPCSIRTAIDILAKSQLE